MYKLFMNVIYNGTRDYMLFYTGINSGMRVSDIVKLTRDDVRNSDGSMKQHITVIEKKNIKGKSKSKKRNIKFISKWNRWAKKEHKIM